MKRAPSRAPFSQAAGAAKSACGRLGVTPKPRMSFEPLEYLRHILVEVNYLLGQSAGLTFA
jgi:hypothetical protein